MIFLIISFLKVEKRPGKFTARNGIDTPCKRNHRTVHWLLMGFFLTKFFLICLFAGNAFLDAELISLQFKVTKFRLLILVRKIHIWEKKK